MCATKNLDIMHVRCRTILQIVSKLQRALFTENCKQGIIPNTWKLMSLNARFKVRYVEITFI